MSASALYVPQALASELNRRNLPSCSLAEHRDAAINPTLHALKLEQAQTNWIGRKGDLVLFITSKDLQDGNGKQPCMLIAHSLNPKDRHVFFPLRDLWVILERGAEQIAIQMAERLYGHATRDDAFRVLDCLFDFGEDLKNAKPPRWITSQQWLHALAEDGFIVTKDGQPLNG